MHLRNCPHLRPPCKRIVLLSCWEGNICPPLTLVGHPSHGSQGHPHCMPESHLSSMLEGCPHLTSGQGPHPTCPHAKWMALPTPSADCKLSAHSMTWVPSTTPQASLCQYLTIHTVTNPFLLSSLNLPTSSLKPFPLVFVATRPYGKSLPSLPAGRLQVLEGRYKVCLAPSLNVLSETPPAPLEEFCHPLFKVDIWEVF